MASIRNPSHAHWDWDTFLQAEGRGPCFPRRITCANVDSETEINGHWLVLEGKRPGEATPKGEVLTMDARVRDGRVVLLVIGNPPGELHLIQDWRTKQVLGSRWHDLWEILKQWARWAESQPRPPQRVCRFVDDVLCAEPDLVESVSEDERLSAVWKRGIPA